MRSVPVKKVLLLTLKALLAVLVLYYVIRSIPLEPAQVSNYLRHSGMYFYASLGVFTLFLVLQAAIWVTILNDGQRRLPYGLGLRIYINSQFAKYIPGGFWNYAGRVALTSREGVKLDVQMTTILYENVLIVLAALVYSLGLAISLHLLPAAVLLPVGLFLLLVYLYYEKGTAWLRRGSVRWMRMRPFRRFAERLSPGSAFHLSREKFFLYLAYFLGSHLVMGAAFWLLLRSFPTEEIGIGYAAGTFASSWLLGLLSPLPGGLGVREGFLVYFLSFRMDKETAVQISVIARLWNVMSEILFFALMNGVHILRKRMRLHGS
ncbi:hypothetical protein SY83_10100 [Paenibacillus swuensis]|uniref:Phosphatidylglycerol lysyltransferase n=1 Tax=Paenibacillus swuensis TaxID=1178515 RepID=A0A172TI77_9BACL|nr:lysylphosphatidylglycerol synthase domain-containing protein [Paenibacillus swuensis]ANE46567.1 hypothetical protein SY83_10100 [Paenibacillus swuensis]